MEDVDGFWVAFRKHAAELARDELRRVRRMVQRQAATDVLSGPVLEPEDDLDEALEGLADFDDEEY